jgi:hypothetical protein
LGNMVNDRNNYFIYGELDAWIYHLDCNWHYILGI